MVSDKQHWNEVFSKKEDQELGWYENDVSHTLKFLRMAELSNKSTVFIPGAGTSNLVDELVKSGCHLILNDISDLALEKLKQRIGVESGEFLHHNMGKTLTGNYLTDIWIDRAVLHFLLDELDISTYFENLRATVKPGGYVLLAEFSEVGATMCAGLNIHQYSKEEMQRRLGEEFDLMASEDYVFINPFGQEKPYIYALFHRRIAL